MKKEKSNARRHLILTSIIFVIFLTLAIFFGAMFYRNHELSNVNRVKGIDVSSYQGKIDWKEIEKQNIYFAFIKATEGKSYKDSNFKENWQNIEKTNIRKGAYLFFISENSAKDMANNYIQTVPKEVKALPPVIDIEISSDSKQPLPKKETVVKTLTDLIQLLKDHYGKDPIIYTNNNTYTNYLTGLSEETKFWISQIDGNVPEIPNREWTFWQYSYRGILNGLDESTLFVDMDLYKGNLNDFYKQFDPSIYEKFLSLFNK